MHSVDVEEEMRMWCEESKMVDSAVNEFHCLVDRVLRSRGVKLLEKYIEARKALRGVLARPVVVTGPTAYTVMQNLRLYATSQPSDQLELVRKIEAQAKWVKDVTKSTIAVKKLCTSLCTLIQETCQKVSTKNKKLADKMILTPEQEANLKGALQPSKSLLQRWNELTAEGGPLSLMDLYRSAEIP